MGTPEAYGQEWAGAALNAWQSRLRCLAVFGPVPNDSQEVRTAVCTQAQHSDMDTAVGTSLCGARRSRRREPDSHLTH